MPVCVRKMEGGECERCESVCEQASKTVVMTEPTALLGVCCAVLHCDRESSDHGPVNSWDRQPFLTDLSDKSPSFIPLYNELSLNFMVANYGGSCRSVWSFCITIASHHAVASGVD